MPKEEIEFTIKLDGTVEERTLGLKGEACEEVTRRLEQHLGEVAHREPTPERYETPEQDAQADQHRAERD